jgi:hypothetical protein
MTTKDEKIETLAGLNEELENYFKNTIIPQLFVDSDLVSRACRSCTAFSGLTVFPEYAGAGFYIIPPNRKA